MLPGGLESVANAINDRDQIAGSSDTAVAHHAFLNEPIPGGGRVFKDLGTTGGSNTSYAYAINNSAQIVGMSAGTDAFVWQRGTGMRKLQELLPAGSQWSLVSAEAINERGVIVGWGYNGGAYVRAFMLKP
jgi:uncharacterized membrane protein